MTESRSESNLDLTALRKIKKEQVNLRSTVDLPGTLLVVYNCLCDSSNVVDFLVVFSSFVSGFALEQQRALLDKIKPVELKQSERIKALLHLFEKCQTAKEQIIRLRRIGE